LLAQEEALDHARTAAPERTDAHGGDERQPLPHRVRVTHGALVTPNGLLAPER
jgi:hypothetical protein